MRSLMPPYGDLVNRYVMQITIIKDRKIGNRKIERKKPENHFQNRKILKPGPNHGANECPYSTLRRAQEKSSLQNSKRTILVPRDQSIPEDKK